MQRLAGLEEGEQRLRRSVRQTLGQMSIMARLCTSSDEVAPAKTEMTALMRMGSHWVS
jgi:hypothetical protein